MKRLGKQGFSMIELLVVLLIIGILAAVAAPFFLQNADKTRASEAVAGAGSIRSSERNYYVQNNSSYFGVTDGATYFGSDTGNQSAVLGVQIANPKYFSPASYTVTVGGNFGATPTGISAAQGYVIEVNGATPPNIAGASIANGAANAGDVSNIMVEMDNSGQTIWSSNAGTSWTKY